VRLAAATMKPPRPVGGAGLEGHWDGGDDGRHATAARAAGRIAHAGDTARAMRRIHDMTHPTQSNLSYLARMLRCLAVCAVSDSHMLTGLAHCAVASVLHRDYDDLTLLLL
jgi:hypothetical protein